MESPPVEGVGEEDMGIQGAEPKSVGTRGEEEGEQRGCGQRPQA